MEPGDKKTSVKLLLDKVSNEPGFRNLIESEAKELTDIGNKFHIRHSEKNQIKLSKDEHIEYLFYRLFSLILLILKTTGKYK